MTLRRDAPLSVAELKEHLAGDRTTATWVEFLETIGAPEVAIELPSTDDLRPILLDLAVPHEDIDFLLASLPTRERSEGLWWLLERCAHSLVREMGAIDGPLPVPPAPGKHGSLAPLLLRLWLRGGSAVCAGVPPCAGDSRPGFPTHAGGSWPKYGGTPPTISGGRSRQCGLDHAAFPRCDLPAK